MGKKLPGARVRVLQVNPTVVKGVKRMAKDPKDSGVARYVEKIALNACGRRRKR